MWPSSWYSTCLSNEELFKIVKKKNSCLQIFVMWTFYHLVLNRVFLTAPLLLKTGPIWDPVKKFWVHIISCGCCVYDFPWKTYNVMDDAGEFDSPWECVWVWPMWPLRRQSMDKRDLCLPPRPPFKAIHPILCPVHYVYHYMAIWHPFDQITFDRKPI